MQQRYYQALTRRAFLGRTSLGLGALTLSSLLAREARGGLPAGIPGLPHFPAKAKRVIFLYMSGGPSHLETFDFKPRLIEMDRRPDRKSTRLNSSHLGISY